MPYFNLWMLIFFFNPIRVSNSLDQDQARHFVGPDLGPNCLQGLSADNKMSCWTLVHTVCKGHQHTTKVSEELNKKKLVDTTCWLKLISFGYNFFNWAKVLATTNSEPELAQKHVILQGISYLKTLVNSSLLNILISIWYNSLGQLSIEHNHTLCAYDIQFIITLFTE